MTGIELDEEGKALRLEAKSLRDVRGRIRCNGAFKDRVARYVEVRRGAGVDLKELASMLSIPLSSLQRWMRSAKGSRRMRPVRVTRSTVERARGAISVAGPRGLRVEGLSVAELADLWIRLG